MWTQFMDMHSGGGTKEPPYECIYIEASYDEACVIFYNRFGHSPHRVSCTCCGEDYSVTESPTLEQSTAYNRGCDYAYFDADGNEVDQVGYSVPKDCEGKYVERSGDGYYKYRTLQEYLDDPGILVIKSDEIKVDERVGDVPDEGYIWV